MVHLTIYEGAWWLPVSQAELSLLQEEELVEVAEVLVKLMDDEDNWLREEEVLPVELLEDSEEIEEELEVD